MTNFTGKNAALRLLVSIAAFQALSGCMQVVGSGEGDAAERMLRGDNAPVKKAAEMASVSTALPKEILALVSPNAPFVPEIAGVEEPRFDVTSSDVPIRAFFQGLVEETPYNIIVHPEVQGTVTVSLNDVSVPEVMALMRDAYGYHFERNDVGFVVLPDTMQSRMFSLDYLNLDRSGSTGTRISAGDIGSVTEDGQSQRDDSAGSELLTVTQSRLWRDVEAMIDRMIASEKPRGASVVTSPEGGSIIVRASPRTLARIDEFIQRLDESLNRQVVLEARILEVELYDDFRAGIEWSAVGSEGGKAMQYSLAPGAQLSNNSDTVFSLGVVQDGGFDATIRALKSQGNVRILSAPRISTLNNVKALIKVGTDAFFQTGVELNTQNFQGERFVDIIPEFSPFFSGIALDVTPNIGRNGWVTLHVQPSVTNVREVARTLDVGDQRASFQLASSEVRQSDSIVRAQDGSLVVIGGLIQEREETRRDAMPVVGSVPGLNWLFGSNSTVSRQVELVILIRPRVIGPGSWSDEVERSANRVQEMYGS